MPDIERRTESLSNYARAFLETSTAAHNAVQLVIAVGTLMVTLTAWWRYGTAWGLCALLGCLFGIAVATGVRLQQRLDAQQLNSDSNEREAVGLLLGKGDIRLKRAWLAGIGKSIDPPIWVETDDGRGILSTPEFRSVFDKAAKWKRDVDRYLEEHFGKAEALLFRSDIGIPPDVVVPPDFDEHRARQEADLYRDIQRRMYRLQLLMEKLPRKP